MDYYYSYNEEFSDHMVLNVAVKIYHLMRDISTNIVRYENFILEQNENVLMKNKKKLTTPKEITQACIWDFMNRIIVDIEISLKTTLNPAHDKEIE